jgi:hypothetical protein
LEYYDDLARRLARGETIRNTPVNSLALEQEGVVRQAPPPAPWRRPDQWAIEPQHASFIGLIRDALTVTQGDPKGAARLLASDWPKGFLAATELEVLRLWIESIVPSRKR